VWTAAELGLGSCQGQETILQIVVRPFIERVPQGLSHRRESDRLDFDRVKYHFFSAVCFGSFLQF